MDELSANNYVIIDQFIHQELFADIWAFFQSSRPAFTKAGIGALENNTIRHDVRGDHTYWLDRNRDKQLEQYWTLVDETMHIFKRYCFLSLSGYEFHLASYPPGAQYEKHLDQFNNRNNRMITIVIYLNQSWQSGDGGELEIYLEDDTSIIVEPRAARCVMFKSAEIPHRVRQSVRDRHSLTGWLLHHPSALGQFFG